MAAKFPVPKTKQPQFVYRRRDGRTNGRTKVNAVHCEQLHSNVSRLLHAAV